VRPTRPVSLFSGDAGGAVPHIFERPQHPECTAVGQEEDRLRVRGLWQAPERTLEYCNVYINHQCSATTTFKLRAGVCAAVGGHLFNRPHACSLCGQSDLSRISGDAGRAVHHIIECPQHPECTAVGKEEDRLRVRDLWQAPERALEYCNVYINAISAAQQPPKLQLVKNQKKKRACAKRQEGERERERERLKTPRRNSQEKGCVRSKEERSCCGEIVNGRQPCVRFRQTSLQTAQPTPTSDPSTAPSRLRLRGWGAGASQ